MAVTYTLRYRPASGTDPNPNAWSEITGLTETSQAVTGLSGGTEYEVEVVAVSAGGVRSTPVSGSRWTVCAPPSAPSGAPAGYELTTGDAGTNGAVLASWAAVTGADSYTVSHRPTGGSTWTDITGVTATSHRISGLSPGQSHEVRVRAVNVVGDVSEASAEATGVPARIATGGNVTRIPATGAPTHVLHTFTSVGDHFLTLNGTADLEYLIVAGGGGGGGVHGGGGGGGGLLTNVGGTALRRAAGSLQVRVGDGGAGGPGSEATPATNGGDSHVRVASDLDLTAVGGGAGGNGFSWAADGSAGGSGGGGGAARNTTDPTKSGGTATAGQGAAGGGSRSGNVGVGRAGGGGGAGGVGTTATASDLGTGGAGLSSIITGSAVTYAGGGGGGTDVAGVASGGTGGGGNGAQEGAGAAGTDGLGGGGGGGGGGNGAGGDGGSGIVILRYALP